MRGRKITSFGNFQGRDLLLHAQKRGVEITGGVIPDATSVTLIGLAAILTERNIGGLADFAATLNESDFPPTSPPPPKPSQSLIRRWLAGLQQ
jgi:hypothetical protein